MIDTHCHVYPPFSKMAAPVLDRLPPPVAERLEQAGLLAAGLVALAKERLPEMPLPSPPTIEQVADLHARLPELMRRPVETLSSLAVLPALLLRGSADALLTSMDNAHIEQSVVIAAPPIVPNDWLLEEIVPRANGRIIPVAGLPELRDEATEREWQEAFTALADKGARGFKIHPNLDKRTADHTAYRALFQVAQKRKLFVILHTGCFHVLGYRHPGAVELAAFEHLFREYPRVSVCLAHMNRDRPEDAWEMMGKYEQLFADTSWQPSRNISRAFTTVGSERIMLGSDWPLLHPGLQSDAVATLRRASTDAQLEQVTTKTPRAFLGKT
jgi:predicted TIM-barrel fold metal-dependent hydrolase